MAYHYGMARYWRERSGRRYGDLSPTAVSEHGGNLLSTDAIAVRICSFTFYFVSKEEIREYIEFFDRKTHPSSRVPANMLPNCSFQHWHSQRWYERLPLFLQEEPKREKVLKALRRAILLIESGKL